MTSTQIEAPTKEQQVAESAFIQGHIEATVGFDYEAVDRGNPLEAELTEATPKNREAALVERFTRAVASIYDAHNSKKSALCFLIATGDLAAQGRKVKSAAQEFGVSKQDISKTCVEWCEFMGIPPSDYMRNEASKESFRQSNTRKQKI